MSERRPAIVPVAIGIGLTAVLLLLLAYVAKKRQAEVAMRPQLTLVAPVPNATVDSPLVVTFRSSRPLELSAAGWSAGQLHLHAWLNGMQIMPAAADIRALPDGSYQWSLTAAGRAPDQQLYLGWADAMHRPVVEGSSRPISITVR